MNKAQLVEAIAKSAGLSKAKAQAALDATIETIVKAVKKGDNVAIAGFGTFKKVRKKARTGINQKTGQKIKIKAKNAPKFSPGKAFKDAVAKGK